MSKVTIFWNSGMRQVLDGETPTEALTNIGLQVKDNEFIWETGDSDKYYWDMPTKEWREHTIMDLKMSDEIFNVFCSSIINYNAEAQARLAPTKEEYQERFRIRATYNENDELVEATENDHLTIPTDGIDPRWENAYNHHLMLHKGHQNVCQKAYDYAIKNLLEPEYIDMFEIEYPIRLGIEICKQYDGVEFSGDLFDNEDGTQTVVNFFEVDSFIKVDENDEGEWTGKKVNFYHEELLKENGWVYKEDWGEAGSMITDMLGICKKENKYYGIMKEYVMEKFGWTNDMIDSKPNISQGFDPYVEKCFGKFWELKRDL